MRSTIVEHEVLLTKYSYRQTVFFFAKGRGGQNGLVLRGGGGAKWICFKGGGGAKWICFEGGGAK